ncbi:Vomp family autotransporter, partial [Bartonella bacilliformis]
GLSSLSNAGLVIKGCNDGTACKNGPSVTAGGINAGDKTLTGVADGVLDGDAVNFSQLKALKETVDKGWMLTVNGADATPVGADGADFSVGSSNLVITKDNKNKLTFDLAEHIEVGRITTGLSSLSNAGLVIKGCNDGTACKNGPSVTAGGINAGDKKLTGLADGVLDGDAVNVAQLNKVKEEVIKGSGLIQQGENEDDNGRITIGAGNSSTEINILNKDGVRRTISGISGGKVTEESTEAINGAQLWETNEEVHNLNHRVDETHTNVSQYFGGGADISSGKAPTYTIEGKQYNNVGSAFSAVNDSLDNIQNEISRHFGQIYTISDIFAHYFGGGAGYNNGKWTAPTYEVSHFDVNGASSEKAYNNVSDAFGGVNESMSGMNDRLQEVENKVDQNKAESDSLGWNKDKGAYDASHDGKPGKIVNVADGQIAQGSGDAVNGGQLWETNERVTNVENKVNDVSKQVDKIGNTIIDINNSVIDMGDRVDSIENAVNHFADGAVSYQRDENGKKTNKVVLQGGDSGKPVTIDNVADGKIEKGSQEAVNGGQLHDYTQEQMKLVLNDAKKYTDGKIKNIVVDAIDDAVSQAKGYTDMKFEALSYGIEGARKEARQAAAIGLAVSNLRYNDTPGRLSFAFGSGMWRSQSAFALGTGYTSEDGRIHSNFSATTAGGHWGIGAGVSITLN